MKAANRLVVYNAQRSNSKHLAHSAQRCNRRDNRPIRLALFETDADEVKGIAQEISGLCFSARDQTLVLGRTRALVEHMRRALETEGVDSTVLGRRDDFASPEMRWLAACLQQTVRPLNRRNMSVLMGAFKIFATLPLELDEIVSRAESTGAAYLNVWTAAVERIGLQSPVSDAVAGISDLASGGARPEEKILQLLDLFVANSPNEDLKDDRSAWQRLTREIRAAVGTVPLERFAQELDLRSKEPVPEPGAVSLSTIQRAKGLEFSTVYLIGLAEEILPSWHSIRKGNGSAALEEERRSCFVAITRTKESLTLSRARRYRGRPKKPSRFLREMGLAR